MPQILYFDSVFIGFPLPIKMRTAALSYVKSIKINIVSVANNIGSVSGLI